MVRIVTKPITNCSSICLIQIPKMTTKEGIILFEECGSRRTDVGSRKGRDKTKGNKVDFLGRATKSFNNSKMLSEGSVGGKKLLINWLLDDSTFLGYNGCDLGGVELNLEGAKEIHEDMVGGARSVRSLARLMDKNKISSWSA